MKILQVHEGGRGVVLDAPTPVPGPDQVLLRVLGVATCPQWDLHLRHNEPMFVGHRFEYPYSPGQPGHEATGVIEAVGAHVTEFSLGDRVSAWRDAGHQRHGCYAQFVVLEAANVIKVRADLVVEFGNNFRHSLADDVTFFEANHVAEGLIGEKIAAI